MDAQDQQSNPYDRIPYISRAFPQTHPEHLAVIARLFGMEAPPLATCRVLELGCASGGNLMPMAAQLPDAKFVGIDLSSRQIAEGQAIIAKVGLPNLELKQFDLTRVDRTFGEFDYIIAHGVYSWIPAEVRDHLMRVCKENLAPTGIAYVSYNVYPGWRMRGMIRDMMLYHARQFPDTATQVQQARALLDFLAQYVPTENSPYGLLLKQEVQGLRQTGDWYLAHEHLEGVNEPTYFHQFIEHANGKGLQYLGETEFHTMLAATFPPAVGETLRKISGDIIRKEQYMDFLRNRTFRQTLLVHADKVLNRNLTWEVMPNFYVAANIEVLDPATPINSAQYVRFRGSNGAVLNTQLPISKAAMTLLAERSPLGYPFEELYAAARARLDASPLTGPPPAVPPMPDDAMLGTELLQSFAAGIVEFRLSAPKAVNTVGERPKVSDLAMFQAAHGLPIANQKHEPVQIDDFIRQVIALLDGRRDRNMVIEDIISLVKTGGMVVRRHDKPDEPVTNETELRALIVEAVDSNLGKLAKHSLLEH